MRQHFVIIAAIIGLAPVAAMDSRTVEISFIGGGLPPVPATLVANISGGGSFVLQESLDLIGWHPFVTVFSRVERFRLIDRSPAPAVQWRFFAAFGPVSTPEQMLEQWDARGLTDYKFTFRRVHFGGGPIILTGVVTVREGVVVAVEDAKGEGLPIENPDLPQFRSIRDLLQEGAALRANSDVVLIGMDHSLSFPNWIEIDRDIEISDDEITYQVSDLVPLN